MNSKNNFLRHVGISFPQPVLAVRSSRLPCQLAHGTGGTLLFALVLLG